MCRRYFRPSFSRSHFKTASRSVGAMTTSLPLSPPPTQCTVQNWPGTSGSHESALILFLFSPGGVQRRPQHLCELEVGIDPEFVAGTLVGGGRHHVVRINDNLYRVVASENGER